MTVSTAGPPGHGSGVNRRARTGDCPSIVMFGMYTATRDVVSASGRTQGRAQCCGQPPLVVPAHRDGPPGLREEQDGGGEGSGAQQLRRRGHRGDWACARLGRVNDRPQHEPGDAGRDVQHDGEPNPSRRTRALLTEKDHAQCLRGAGRQHEQRHHDAREPTGVEQPAKSGRGDQDNGNTGGDPSADRQGLDVAPEILHASGSVRWAECVSGVHERRRLRGCPAHVMAGVAGLPTTLRCWRRPQARKPGVRRLRAGGC